MFMWIIQRVVLYIVVFLDKESASDESKQSPPDSLSFLAPPPSDLPRSTSAGSLSIPASRPRPKVYHTREVQIWLPIPLPLP